MKKLIFVAVLLIVVLLVSWWAKGANFDPFTMLHSFQQVKGAATQTPTVVTQSPTPIPVEIIITLTPNGFVPDAIMITPGTKITWINKTPFPANISSDPQAAYPLLNLGDFGQNNSLSQVFPTAGRYQYINGKNTTQKGILVVK